MAGNEKKDHAVVLYEGDELCRSFYPLTLTRPVCFLLFGVATIGEKIAVALGSIPELVLTHPDIGAVEVGPDLEDGIPSWQFNTTGSLDRRKTGDLILENGGLSRDILFLSSGFIPAEDPVDSRFPADTGVFFRDTRGDLVGFFLPAHKGEWKVEDLRNPTEDKLSLLTGLSFTTVEIGGRRISYPRERVEANPGEIAGDIPRNIPGVEGKKSRGIHPTAVLTGDHYVIIGEGASVGPFSLVDSTKGPIYLARGASVGDHSVVRGPAFIGEGTQVLRALIRGGCSIGAHCRVGGELEQSILHGYVNKYHEGFLGHSYIGSWVNLGAGTTNSDLKNNYGPVRVRLEEVEFDTGQTKVGTFMGDHVKTGIGTLMNTGFICGTGCNLFGGSGVLPKFIPPFVWGDGESMEEYIFRNFEDTARIVMGRRGVEMSERYSKLLLNVFESTSSDREVFLGI